MSHFFSTEFWTKRNFHIQSLLFHCLGAETSPVTSQGRGLSLRMEPGRARAHLREKRQKGRQVEFLQVLDVRDPLMSRGARPLTSDTAADVRPLGPEGQRLTFPLSASSPGVQGCVTCSGALLDGGGVTFDLRGLWIPFSRCRWGPRRPWLSGGFRSAQLTHVE